MKVVIEIERGWTTPDFKSIQIARVFYVEDEAKRRWPTMRQKPVISLMGTDESIASAIDQTRLWVQGDCLSADEIKAQANAEPEP